MLKIAVVTVSDRASLGVYKDKGGPTIIEELKRILSTPWKCVSKIVPDEKPLVESTLKELCDVLGCSLVITTGGTGPAPRDITPDATIAVSEKILDGFGELMRQVSLKKVPTAILSRQMAGIRGKTLIINLPGKPSAIKDCLQAVFPAVPDCIELIGGPLIEIKKTSKLISYTPHRNKNRL